MTGSPALPARVLRVGVTGARAINPAAAAALAASLSALLARIAAAAGTPAPRLLLLSALAEGSDRLAAEAALASGYALVCPLPFPAEEYAQDFPDSESRDAFRRLLDRAEGRVLALDGGRGEDEARSYEAVGRLIVRNCDLLIGVWDGRPGGIGGTAETIRYAARSGPPVIWLHAEAPETPPRWIGSAHDLRAGAPPRPVEEALGVYLGRLLTPPAAHAHRHPSLLHRLGHAARHLMPGPRRAAHNPLLEFLQETPRPARGLWRAHGWLMRRMSGRNPPWTPPRPPEDAAARHWFAHYQPADERAGECAARDRSSYVLAFGLGAVALAAAAVALGFAEVRALKLAATLAEFVALLAILGLVVGGAMLNWHQRAIEYRLLAELCRKQQALAPLAWAVPRAGAWATGEPAPAPDAEAPQVDPGDWVSWLFSAWLRAAPLPTGVLDAARVQAMRAAAVHDLIDEQIKYHTDRRAQCHLAGRRLVHLGEALFLLVLVLVAVKLTLLVFGGAERHTTLLVLGLFGAILPALSAAFVGIRAYAELETMAEQSDAMLTSIRAARQRIAELDLTLPLASQALGSALAPVALLMLEDLQGWARLFRAKMVEA